MEDFDLDAAVDELLAHCGNDNAPIGSKATGYSEPELGPFLCLNCVHSNREGNRCNHPDVVADPELEKEDGLAVIQPAACCNEFHPRHPDMKAYGTSEGVTKAWDTRGRGTKESTPSSDPEAFIDDLNIQHEQISPSTTWDYIDTPKGQAVLNVHRLWDDKNTVEIHWLIAEKRGAGRAAMEHVVAMADKNHVRLGLWALPLPSQGENQGFKISKPQLEKFYRSFGFKADKSKYDKRMNSNYMIREPKKASSALDAAVDELFGEALFRGVMIEGFSHPDEEFIRATISRVPPELLTHVKRFVSHPGLEPKHGRYDPDTETINLSPHDFQLKERMGKGPGSIHHAELTIVHEIGHSIYTFMDERLKDEWRAISGWMVGTAAGQAQAYEEKRPGWPKKISKMTHKAGVKFTRKYAERNDDEDFADSVAFYVLGKPHQMAVEKRKFLDELMSNMVKIYPQTSIQGPVKPT